MPTITPDAEWVDFSNAASVTTTTSLITAVTDAVNGDIYTATLTARPTYTTAGKNGLNVATFNGTANALLSTNTINSVGPPNTLLRTFVCVFNVTGSGVNRSLFGAHGSGGFECRVNASEFIEVLSNNTASLATGATVVTSGWHIVIVTQDATTVNIYLDSPTVVDGTGAGTTLAADTYYIGAQNGSEFFKTDIGEIQFFNTVRNGTDRTTIYNDEYLKWFVSVPSTPAAPVAEISHKGSHVTWVAPANGGSAITGYLLEQNAGGGGWTTVGTLGNVLEYSVTGLTIGTSYQFRVSAINVVGTSSVSSASNSVTPVDFSGDLLLEDGTSKLLLEDGTSKLELEPPLAVNVSQTDTGSGTDSQSITVAVTQTDTGSGTETQTIALAMTDTGSGSDSQSITVAAAQTDSGTGTDSQVTSAALTQTDTGSGADAQSIAVSFAQSDTGSGADSTSIAVAIGQTDTGGGTETQSISLAQTDTGSGVDAQTTSADLGVTDTGSGSETQGIASAETDNGAGVDTQGIAAALTQTDSGSGADAQAISAVLGQTDSGSGTETQSLGVGVTDTGTATETWSITVSFTVTDTGVGSDDQTVQKGGGDQDISQSDSWSGVDAQAITAVLGQADAGVGADAQSIAVTFATADTGHGSDTQSIVVTIVQTDSGTGTDGQGQSVAIGQSDSGSAVDSFLTSALLAQFDTGIGTDSQLVDKGGGHVIIDGCLITSDPSSPRETEAAGAIRSTRATGEPRTTRA